jgi:protein-L-isoaspartate(D-aspartate) O-methyltransferase
VAELWPLPTIAKVILQYAVATAVKQESCRKTMWATDKILESLRLYVVDANPGGEDRYAMERLRMVEEINEMAHEVQGFVATPISEKVLTIMGRVPRHRFVPEYEIHGAYYNCPLPIGHGQTISQPYIVALMTELLAAGKQDSVLEIGTGSGYQAAILAEMVGKVYCLEIIEPLGTRAANLLSALGYANVQVKIGDGYQGWPEYAPFDRIIVTAAAPNVPQPLLEQLKPGGRMVIPMGDFAQELVLITKSSDGKLDYKNVLPVRFVPLTGGIRR